MKSLTTLRTLAPAVLRIMRTHGRMVARLLIGAFGSYACAEYFGFAQSFWSVITALVVIQANVGGTVTVSIDRLVGTVAGALVGALVTPLLALAAPVWLALLIALVPLAFMAATRPGYRIAPITAVIVILAGADFHPFWLGAAYRVLEISLGTVFGVLVSLLVFPSHAHRAIRRQCARAMGPLADLLDRFLVERGRIQSDRIIPLHDKVRAAIAAAEKSVQDARREPGARHLDLGVEIRALRRIHSDVIFVGRATDDWPQAAEWPELDSAIEGLADVSHRAFEALGHALTHGGSTSAIKDLDQAVGKVIEVLSMASERAPDLAAAAQQKLGVLPFTIQTLRRDITDLADLLQGATDTETKAGEKNDGQDDDRDRDEDGDDGMENTPRNTRVGESTGGAGHAALS
ncbi:putative membrane protein YccC [Robbsia andropogonis]|uniref:FUSC family protein n=1 Tax=Robbsia andropogonis TaxID=28092 RepID=UPI000A5F2871|nr:FUSC family protein [Robbsia andropogonis]MCP1119951.1 FUSC family protein [Robbsia andropogonis]MCP1129821.1 FUSC family protein [Robbsia andropogonis]